MEARIRELRLPKVQPLSEGELTKIASGQHHWLWQHELIQALNTWIKTEDPIGKGNALVETVWKVIYRGCQPTPTHPAGAAARPAPQGWYAQAQQPAPQQAQTQPSAQAQAPAPGPPGACFRCGMHGHWARDGASGGQGRAPSVAGPVAGSYRGGFSTFGSQSLYTAHSTGRTYDATAPPPPVPVFSVRPQPLGRGRPVPGTACPAPLALSGRAGPSAGQLMRGQVPAAASGPPAGGAPMTRGAERSACVMQGRQWTAYGGELHGGAPRVGHPVVVPRYRGAVDRDPPGCGPVRSALARAGRSGGPVTVPRQARRHGPAA